jgi:DNA-binding CsgD family transcriptional regulator
MMAQSPSSTRQPHSDKAKVPTPDGLGPSLPLSGRETMVAKLFADNRSADQISDSLGLALDTVNAYLTRVHAKYASADRRADEPLQLRTCLIQDGLIDEETRP